MQMITLRKLEPSDLPFLYRWENDASSWQDGSNHHPLSQADLREYIASTTGDIFRDGQLRLIICDGDLTMGCADLFDLDARNRKAALGLYLAPEFRGSGVGRSALSLLEDLAFRHLGLRLIYAFVSESNTACMSLFRSASYSRSSSLPAWTLESPAILWHKLSPILP